MAIPGGTESLRQRAGMVTGNRAVFTADGEVCSGSVTSAQPSNPTGITSTTQVMLGLAGTVTPNAGGNVLVMMSGDIINSGIAGVATLQIYYGTGTAPANNVAFTGTAAGTVQNFVASTAAGKSPFAINAYLTGLVGGTAYWLDLAATASANTTTVQHVNIIAIEL